MTTATLLDAADAPATAPPSTCRLVIPDVPVFRTAFRRAAAFVNPRTPKPALLFVLCEASADGVRLSATDLEAWAAVTAGVVVEVPGRLLLPAAELSAILQEAGAGPLTIEATSDALAITGDGHSYDLPARDPDEFPVTPPFPDDGAMITAPAGALAKAIRRTLPCCDPETTRYNLGGCLFEGDGDGNLALVATDGRRLARQEVVGATGGPSTDRRAVVVPERFLKELGAFLKAEGEDGLVAIAFQGNNLAHFRGSAWTLSTRLAEGRFPRYQDVFPDRPEYVRLEAAPFAAAIARAGVALTDESRGVHLELGGGRLKLTARSEGRGRATASLAVADPDADGVSWALTIGGQYLEQMIDGLGDTGSAVVKWGIVGPKDAVTVKTDDGFMGALMPMS